MNFDRLSLSSGPWSAKPLLMLRGHRDDRPQHVAGRLGEIAAFCYRVLHAAAQLTRSARQVRLRIDRTWRWVTEIAEGFRRLDAAFA